MALSNRERISKALELLTDALRPWVAQQLIGKFGTDGISKAQEFVEQAAKPGTYVPKDPDEWDIQALLTVIFGLWRIHFRDVIGTQDNTMLHELQNIRNEWAHQKPLGTNDTLRALDTVNRLLQSISASESATEVEKMHGDAMRTLFTERQRTAVNRAQRQATEGTPQGGLRPWREVIVPHADVREGNFTQAEFAADLAQVHRGGAPSEYGDPREFFRRTFITEGLRGLIANAFKRLNGQGGHPVIELQTNFGGGKTHSMLALYHLVSGVDASQMLGVDVLLKETGLKPPPSDTRRAVLVGTALAPGQAEQTPDGLALNTLWGRLAYQLGGKDAYALIADSDRHGTSPGSDDLVRLFKHVGPCLILIDEWVAYCRQTYETHGLPGGSFDQNLTFAQALTEAVKASPTALLVASLPQSQIEVGGTGGKEALASLEDTFGRLEFNWRPANQEESYEIVRRRLFEPISDPSLFAERDAVITAFYGVYSKNKVEFPTHTAEGQYEQRMRLAYPIHPELFDRLYNDWASLEEFQRTRGVLRLMATVIHVLWSRNDRSLMILPGLIPMDEPLVVQELTRYLRDNWQVIIGTDVDGSSSLPRRLDSESSRYGQYWATRRVARSIYLGSAPVQGRSNKGLDIRNVRLGCMQPGENLAVFGDALRQFGDHASHLYADGSRYWFAAQPNVLTLARDRAARIEDSERIAKIHEWLIKSVSDRGGFHRVHAPVMDASEIPDEPETRLVVLVADRFHTSGSELSPALQLAKECLDKRGNAPRMHRNSLVFVAADKSRIDDLKEAAAWYLAWESISHEREQLNLDPFNVKMTETRLSESAATLRVRLPEAFQWLIVPSQSSPMDKVSWDAKRVTGGDSIAQRVWNRLKRDDQIRDHMAGTILRFEMDRYLWKNQPHIGVRQLMDYFSRYLYLPRVSSPHVVFESIRDGVNHAVWNPETFAYADRYDEDTQRYIGLTAGKLVSNVATDAMSLLVKPDVAETQLSKESPTVHQPTPVDPIDNPGGILTPVDSGGGQTDASVNTETDKRFTRYYGVVPIADATRLNRDVGQISKEVVEHLTGILGAEVKVTIEVHAKIPQGLTEQQVRTLSENCRSLKFRDYGFE